MTQTDRGNRTLVAATRLRTLIVSGALAPGQRISEREVGEQLDGLSRTPLREALKILETEGLVTLSPNRGAVVTALSVAEVGAAIEVLVGLEAMAAELACQRITAQEIAAIEELHTRMRAAYLAGELMGYFELNQAIHQRIVDAAQNPALSRIYAAECARIRRYRYAGNRRHDRWDRAIAEHDQILDTLRLRDGPLLREMLRAHHQNGWSVSRALLESEAAQAVAPAPARRARRVAETSGTAGVEAPWTAA
jgi:DNA-binding GntR family transcriptional regulator